MKLCLRCNQYFDEPIDTCPSDGNVLENVGKDPLIGALINNRYLVDAVIGKGSSGIVYKAGRLGRGSMVVAIKVLHSYIGAAGAALDRFLREAQAAAKLRNPHIITIWDSGVTEDGQPYFVMDYLEGSTLGCLIKEKGNLEPKRVLSLLHQICEALGEAHRQGIVHRDLKPENVVLQESDHGHDYVKLLDFGIADSPQHAQSSFKLEKPRTVSGSPAYMSPEQCQGLELDGRSDIYSLAIVVFEMLTGCRPFPQKDNVNVMVLHVNEPPMTMSEVRPDLNFPQQVEAVIAKALSKQPSDRQATVQEFLSEFAAAWQSEEHPLAALAKAVEPITNISNSNLSGLKKEEYAKAITSDELGIQDGDNLVAAWGNVSFEPSNKTAVAPSNGLLGALAHTNSDALNGQALLSDIWATEDKNNAASLSLASSADRIVGAELIKRPGRVLPSEPLRQPEIQAEMREIFEPKDSMPFEKSTVKSVEMVAQPEDAASFIAKAEAPFAAGDPRKHFAPSGIEQALALANAAELRAQQETIKPRDMPKAIEMPAASKLVPQNLNEQSVSRNKTVDRLMEAAQRGQTHQKMTRKTLPNPELARTVKPPEEQSLIAKVKESSLIPKNIKSEPQIPDLPREDISPTASGWYAMQNGDAAAAGPEPDQAVSKPTYSPKFASAPSASADPTTSVPAADSVQSYSKRAMTDSRLSLSVNNQVHVPTDNLVSEATYARAKATDLLTSTRQGFDEAKDIEFHIKQKYRNTLSQLEGWKKARRADNSLISTRARAAALKADSERPPLNLWRFSVGIIVSACLLASAYVVYSALIIPPPPAASVQTLLNAGNYEKVIDILEGKKLSDPLSEADRDQLNIAYLNVAKQNAAADKPDQALSYLTKIDPKSSAAVEANEIKTELLQAKKSAARK